MIFQEPMTSLNPVFTAGFQLKEAVNRKESLSKKELLEKCVNLLDTVGIPSPEKRIDSYPHEFSGGMRQRIMIAMALAASPSLLIADEPTTALDVTIQAQILDLLLEIQKKNSMSLMLITHDLGIVANTCDSIAVMYAGEIVEYGSSKDIFSNPLHPYTAGLFEAIPRIGSGTKRLKTIGGSVPVEKDDSPICSYYPRCPIADTECAFTPVVNISTGSGRQVRCLKCASAAAPAEGNTAQYGS
jgi:oligopeptide/dipeptide ABC transporter ATP-binding protein